jgi:type VI secretion system secreted protein Hcp
MPIYMCYDNLSIPGDVTATDHESWIELNSVQWGVARSIAAPVGAVADRESSAPTVSEITVSKANDKASPKLFVEALEGEGKTVQIDFCKTDAGKLQAYISLTLTNCMISGNTVSSSGDRPQESLTLSFTKFQFKNLAMKAAGDPGEPEILTYDLALARIC